MYWTIISQVNKIQNFHIINLAANCHRLFAKSWWRQWPDWEGESSLSAKSRACYRAKPWALPTRLSSAKSNRDSKGLSHAQESLDQAQCQCHFASKWTSIQAFVSHSASQPLQASIVSTNIIKVLSKGTKNKRQVLLQVIFWENLEVTKKKKKTTTLEFRSRTPPGPCY